MNAYVLQDMFYVDIPKFFIELLIGVNHLVVEIIVDYGLDELISFGLEGKSSLHQMQGIILQMHQLLDVVVLLVLSLDSHEGLGLEVWLYVHVL
jgi:hypothetical protein